MPSNNKIIKNKIKLRINSERKKLIDLLNDINSNINIEEFIKIQNNIDNLEQLKNYYNKKPE